MGIPASQPSPGRIGAILCVSRIRSARAASEAKHGERRSPRRLTPNARMAKAAGAPEQHAVGAGHEPRVPGNADLEQPVELNRACRGARRRHPACTRPGRSRAGPRPCSPPSCRGLVAWSRRGAAGRRRSARPGARESCPAISRTLAERPERRSRARTGSAARSPRRRRRAMGDGVRAGPSPHRTRPRATSAPHRGESLPGARHGIGHRRRDLLGDCRRRNRGGSDRGGVRLAERTDPAGAGTPPPPRPAGAPGPARCQPAAPNWQPGSPRCTTRRPLRAASSPGPRREEDQDAVRTDRLR